MLKSHWLLAPLFVQMILVGTDEFLFHRKRGLPRWERLGHPLDTATVAACLGWALSVPPRPRTIFVFAGMVLFSTIFVTKDEWVHHGVCPPTEHWLHACLFALHPTALIGVGLLWPAAHGMAPAAAWISSDGGERISLILACALTIGFAGYQSIYWNLLWREDRNR